MRTYLFTHSYFFRDDNRTNRFLHYMTSALIRSYTANIGQNLIYLYTLFFQFLSECFIMVRPTFTKFRLYGISILRKLLSIDRIATEISNLNN